VVDWKPAGLNSGIGLHGGREIFFGYIYEQIYLKHANIMKTINAILILIVVAAGCQSKKGGASEETGNAQVTTAPGGAESGQASDEIDKMADAWVIEGSDTELSNTWAEDAYGGDSEDIKGFFWVSANGDTIYKKTEVPPEFVGGQEALVDYLRDNVKYPADVEEGNVYVAFVVTDKGAIADARVVKGIRESMDREALRVVEEMPLWDPAMYGGRAVYAVHGIPVPFNP
jgi:hypothetical protein